MRQRLFAAAELLAYDDLVGMSDFASVVMPLLRPSKLVDQGTGDGGKARGEVNSLRSWLSWIERLTTNQKVGGSNPSERTIWPRSSGG
ncbi:Hypothetical protein DEACI_0479 [Acididesulfobacillus acetoxydans]|uniref:Uncharacterized protein n=1 Tax=Acididesulfobacillus acetoxydans TaxID=1561005 RepID=A0A8S0W6H5_9FIRM|nr:Hypothetical protein DEACI_0479 [Acididesulfobacillus acetoxydans]CEJ07415.1 Hypothetical protein DEACI_1878 [Acididesulfobacillus acetoxydans]